MELRHLRYFVAVAEELHFARAAERLDISPPSLTQQIQNLEAELGARLLNRTKRSVSLTDGGARFLEEARKAVRQAENAELIGKQAGRGEIGRIEIAYMTTASCAGVVSRVLADYNKSHPGVDIRLIKLETPEQLASLAEGRIDIGFLRPPDRYPTGLAGIEIWHQPVMIALPENHPLAHRSQLECADLANDEFILPSVEAELAYDGYVNSVAEQGGFTPRVSRRARDYLSIVTLVAAGFGVAAVPASFSRIQMPGVRYLAINLKRRARIAIGYRRQERAPAIKSFIERIRKLKLQSE
jgi:DNA-binding transcriptional LysR family regulator